MLASEEAKHQTDVSHLQDHLANSRSEVKAQKEKAQQRIEVNQQEVEDGRSCMKADV